MKNHYSQNIKISIIIPVYNAEKHINRALDSACNQTFHDLEIICINDGSTDDSVNLIKLRQKTDNRIKLLSQQNQGAAAARHTGLKIAKGQYVCPLDADDWLDLNAVESGYKEAISKYYDAVLFERVFINDQGIYGKINMDNMVWPISGRNAMGKTIGGWKIHASGLFKTKLMLDCSSQIKLKSINADEFLTRVYFYHANEVSHVDVNYYYYDNQDSTVKKFKKSWWTYLDTQRAIRSFLIEKKEYNTLMTKAIHGDLCRALELQFNLILHAKKLTNEDRKLLAGKIKEFLSEIPNTEYLKLVFSKHDYHKIRFYALLASIGMILPFTNIYYHFKLKRIYP